MTSEITSSKLKSGKIVLIALAAVLLIVAFIAFLNFRLNPLVYRAAYMQEVATHMQNGKNFSIYDPNINWRALRREQIEMLEETPQVVVSGGSRWQEAASSHVPNKTFFNAHGHSDYNEDFFAIVDLLEKNERMPETLILSLRYRIFEPVELRTHTGWREWVPEYREMAAKIGVTPHSYFDTTKMDHWTALLSTSDLWAQMKRRFSGDEHPSAIDIYTTATLDVIGSDGSLRWSQKNADRFTPDYAAKDAQKRLDRFVDFDLRIDQKMVGDVEKLMAYLAEKDVSVVLAQTPFHPIFYDGIQGTGFGNALAQIEQLGSEISARYGFQKVGSFNPHELGCPLEEFIDWHHGTPACLAKVFDQISFPE